MGAGFFVTLILKKLLSGNKTLFFMSEDQIQASFYQTAFNTYPQIRGLLFSVPNGSTRHPLEAMKLKATGLTPGIPDMLLLWGGKCYAFEFKVPGGHLSPVQVKIHEVWSRSGIEVRIWYTTESALEWLVKIISK